MWVNKKVTTCCNATCHHFRKVSKMKKCPVFWLKNKTKLLSLQRKITEI